MIKEGEKLNSIYKVESILGKGAFGSVYKCVDESSSNDYVAIKVFRNNQDAAERELGIFNDMKRNTTVDQLEDNSLIRMLDTFTHKKLTCLVFPLYGPKIFEVVFEVLNL